VKKILAVVFFSVITAISVSAQNGDSELPIVINEIHIESKGITRENALRRRIYIEEGEIFQTREELEDRVADQILSLLNKRIFDIVTLDYDIIRSDGEYRYADLYLYVDETWNLIILPYGKYDNNDGALGSLRIRDYNFLGMMETLSLDLNGEYNPDASYGESKKVSMSLSYLYRFNLGNQPMSFSFTQGGTYFMGAVEREKYYAVTKFNLSTQFDTGINFIGGNNIYYKFVFLNDMKYQASTHPFANLSEARRDLFSGVSHGITVGRVDWIDNYRNGYSFSVMNTYKYNFLDDFWKDEIDLEFRFYKEMSPLCYAGRIYTLYRFAHIREEDDTSGNWIRGIKDSLYVSRGGIYFNNTLLLTLFRWGNIMEMQGGLIFDCGYLFDYIEEYSDYRDRPGLLYTSGIEVMVYPLFAKSLYLRASLAFNLNEVYRERTFGDDNWEVFIGLGHSF
jgi:outer membrane protein assembly factor BamA